MNPPDTTPETQGGVALVSAALVECQAELKAAEFDATNPFFKSKYATLGSVIAASRQALAKSGLAILQIPTINEHLVSVHTKIVHKSGQMLDCGAMTLSLGESDRNSDAQLAGSITTYLRRYAWSTVLGIYADSDDDGNEAPKGAVARQPYQKPQSANPPAKTAPSGVSAPNSATMDPKVLDRYRMKALNNLQAAPGQTNRVLFTHFAMSKGWINGTQEPEQIPAEHVPTSPEAMAKLVEALSEFEGRQREVVP